MPLQSTNGLFRQRTTAVVLAALSLFVGLAATGCGGDEAEGSGEDAKALIDKAFSTPIRSANVKLDAELQLDVPGASRPPLQFRAKGPFVANGRKLPELDLDVTIGAKGQGQSLEGGLRSTGDRLFIKFGGEYFEQPKARVDAANRDLARQQRGGRSLVDPGAWITGARMEGDETVAGVDSRHATLRIDVRRMLGDLNEIARKGVSWAGGRGPQPLSRQRLDETAESLKDPTFDTYVGKEDETIHRISGNVALSVPAARRKAGQISGGSLRFTLELSDTNGTQQVDEPARSRPISELSRQLGGAAALGALGRGQGGTPGDAPGTQDTPQGSGVGTSDPDAIRRYIVCLDRSSPGDDAARERCRSEFR